MQVGGRSADLLGWIASLLIHALTLGAAIVLAADLSLIPKQKPFQWNVSLVAAPRLEAVMSDHPVPSHAGPTSPFVDREARVSKANTSRSTSRARAKIIRAAPKSAVEVPSSSLRTRNAATADLLNGESQSHGTPLSSGGPPLDRHSDQGAEQYKSAIEPQTDPASIDPAGLLSQVERADQPPPDVEAPSDVVAASEPAIRQPDRLAYRPAPEFRDPVVSRTLHADYGWLAEDIFAKVETFKRYPYLAKTNRWQGNVVLQAMISEDGRVSDIKVVESSGHTMLDRDAANLLAQISPITLKHPLGQSHIVVQIPIGYRLE
ncbi:MAG TPA: TonB family protein [Nitrospiraceae bacterium]|nr:TonB family protein [Nitrospiraceae bacterium]